MAQESEFSIGVPCTDSIATFWPIQNWTACRLTLFLTMFGVGRSDFDALISRVAKQENFVGLLQHRMGGLEYKSVGFDTELARFGSRLAVIESSSLVRGKDKQRKNMLEDESETNANDALVVPSHRGAWRTADPSSMQGLLCRAARAHGYPAWKCDASRRHG